LADGFKDLQFSGNLAVLRTIPGYASSIAAVIDKANELHAQLVEAAAESDEKLMESFFESETLTEEELIKGLKLGVKTRGIFPIFCVSATKNMGITRLMDLLWK